MSASVCLPCLCPLPYPPSPCSGSSTSACPQGGKSHHNSHCDPPVTVANPAGSGPATPAQRVALTRTNRNCDGTVAGAVSSTSFGFVILTKPASGRLIATVVVQGASAFATYNIRLIQVVQDNSDCASFINGPFDGSVTTNSNGNGQTNVQEPVLAGATSAFVVLNNANNPGGDFFTTRLVTF